MSHNTVPSDLSPAEKRAMLAELLKRKASATFTVSPLSYGQRALWFIYQLDPSSSAYNISLSLRLLGRLDVAALQRTVAALIQRHGSLRATFSAGSGEPRQIVRSYIDTPFELVDVRGCTADALLEHVLSIHRRPYDLEKGPACRAALFTVTDEEHVLLFGAHHVVVDARSLGILLEELMRSYDAAVTGTTAPLAPVVCEYTAFVEWQTRALEEQGPKMEAFWRACLAEPLPVLELSADRARPPVQSFRGGALSFQLPPALVSSLNAFAKSQGVTLFGLLLAAYFVLLNRYSSQQDIVVGSPALGRSRMEFERIVGYFVNPIALRGNLTGTVTVRELIAQVRQTVQRALANQDYPFPLLVERLQPERASNRPPVFQVMFNLMRMDWLARGRADAGQWQLSSVPLTLEPYTIPQEEGQFDLALDMVETGEQLGGMLRYSSDLFDRATIERMVGHYQTLLDHIVKSPDMPLSSLPILTDEELRVLNHWNATELSYDSDEGVESMFVVQAARTPDALAVESSGIAVSYRDLDQAANRLAAYLRARGVGPETLVGVCVRRTPEMLVALLGILKAGGAYVPLDPAFPSQRLALMAEDAQLRLILIDDASRAAAPNTGAELVVVSEVLSAHGATAAPPPLARGEHLAYVLYTSGSTGKPKGVQVTRQAFTNFIRAMQHRPGLAATDVMLAVTTLSFDIAGLELFLPLSVGARIVLATREEASDAAALRAMISNRGVTVMQATPATWRMLLAAGWTGHQGLRMLCGGEALPADLAIELRRQGTALWNLYGPTETTVWSTIADVTAPDTPITIGRPIANTRVYVLDERRQLLPVGVWGELWIGGDGVARGYLRRPDLTADRFLDNPFSAVAGDRMYRTGDRARIRPDGTLDCQGRLDFQVKVRGFRIELEEIEAALREQPGVLEAVVVVDGAGDRARLLGGVRLAPDAALDATARRDQLRERLPDYMVPAALIVVEAWPLTPNQKIDRPRVQTLLAAVAAERGGDAAGAHPVTSTEQALAVLWADLLRVTTISRSDNFFVLGGHSLLATQLVARIREHFDVGVPLRRVFETTTLEALAADIDNRRGQHRAMSHRPDLVPVSRTAPLRASHTQERLWFIQQLFPESAAYHIPVVLRLEGPLEADALQRSWTALVERHEGLRTRFTVDGDHVIQHTDAQAPMTIQVVTTDSAEAEAEVKRLCDGLARAPFDLARGPLVRAVLIATPDAHVLVLVSHHIVSDQWSLGVVLRELIALYREATGGSAAVLPPLPVQYADYAAWARRCLEAPTAEAARAYWAQQLDGLPVLEFPGDHPRPPVPSMRGAALTVPLDAALCARGQTLAIAEGVTLATCLTATFAVLLGRYTGQHDLPLGIAVANRDHSHLTNVIGAFINTLVLRLQLTPGATFRDLLARVQAVSLDAYAHQEIPFDHLVATLQTSRDLSRSPLVQVMFNVLNTPTHGIEWPGLRWTSLLVDRGGAQLDLSVYVDTQVSKTMAIEYNTDVFDAETIRRFAGHYIQLLSTLVNAPEQAIDHAPLLTPTEHAQLETWNATSMAYDAEEGVEAIFAAQARRVPDAVAVDGASATLRYRELDEMSNRLAWRLQAAGVGPDSLVGVCMQRTPDMLVALLGILKAGGSYVPLDPAFPTQRLLLMAEDAQLRLILTDAATRQSVPQIGADLLLVAEAGKDQPSTQPVHRARGDNLAYVLYTSGSTGKPKGVQVSRRALTNFIRAMQQEPGLSDRDAMLALTTLSFDIAGLELFLPLSVGARIVLATRQQATDGAALRTLIASSGVTVMQATPATFRMLLSAGWTGHRTLRLLCGGEPLPADLAAELRRQGAALWNMYGPTETTVWSTLADVTAPDAPITIGRPIGNTRIYILDERRQRVPIGVWGELWIGGDGVARGYLGRPDLTRERFLDDPFDPGGRMYRTGDRARVRRDGTLECQGRLDFQVKVRGFRIELEEIETALREQPGVLEAVVVVDGTGDRARLLGGVRLSPDAALDERARRDQLRDRLPDYMIPAALLAVETWPLTANQKIDRPRVQTLLAAAATERGSDAAGVPPVTPTEQALAALWADLLRVATIHATDNFFMLGGHSLLATQLVARIREHFAVDIPLRVIFEYDTLTALAARIDALVLILQLAESTMVTADEPREEIQF